MPFCINRVFLVYMLDSLRSIAVELRHHMHLQKALLFSIAFMHIPAHFIYLFFNPLESWLGLD